MGEGREERESPVVVCICGQFDENLECVVYFLVSCPFCDRPYLELENTFFEKRTPRRAELRLVK